jgi:hypothetical protein
MTSDYAISIVLFAIGAVLIFLGWPNKDGTSPRFLRFEAALVLYAPLVLAFIVGGIAELITALESAPH